MPDHPSPAVRAASADDLDRLVEVGRAADALFGQAGIEVPPDDYADLWHADRLLVIGRPAVGYVALSRLDGAAHLEQLAVHPDHGRRGLGSMLLEAACADAAAHGYAAITLTTFRDVPWNGPWYTRRGFTEVPAEQWGPELREQWRAEADTGIAVAPRIVMRRPLSPHS